MFKLDSKVVVDTFNMVKDITGYTDISLVLIEDFNSTGSSRIEYNVTAKRSAGWLIIDVEVDSPVLYMDMNRIFLYTLYSNIVDECEHDAKGVFESFRKATGLSRSYTMLYFVLLHEIGHWHDAKNGLVIDLKSKVMGLDFSYFGVPYRQVPAESFADKYALDIMQIIADSFVVVNK